jgi:hypothetical protein
LRGTRSRGGEEPRCSFVAFPVVRDWLLLRYLFDAKEKSAPVNMAALETAELA